MVVGHVPVAEEVVKPARPDLQGIVNEIADLDSLQIHDEFFCFCLRLHDQLAEEVNPITEVLRHVEV